MGYFHKRTKRSQHRRKRHQKGGDASNFVSSVVGGTVSQQFANVFGASGTSNVIKPMGQTGGSPGGSKRRRQRGGYWAQVINNAVVPLSLFALNSHLAKSRRSKRSGASYTMKRRR